MHKPLDSHPMPRLLQLMRDNLAAPRKFESSVRGEGADAEATIYVYDVIDSYWGIKAADFVQALAGITAPTIHLRINSPGGDVFDARAMATAIRGHKSRVIAHVDGMALSAATTLAVACAEVQMAEGAFFMIHQAWTLMYGNANDLIEMADLLEKIDAAIAADYGRKTKKSNEQIVQWMADETWFTAQEAVDAGFADSVSASADEAAAAVENRSKWNIAAYEKAPKTLTEKPAPAADDENKRAAADEAKRLAAQRAHNERRLALIQRT